MNELLQDRSRPVAASSASGNGRPRVATTLDDALEEVAGFARRFIVFTDPRHADAIALWVAHTYVMEAFESTMYLAITSPEKGSGKTRVLEVVERIAHRPWRVTTPSEAVLFSKLEQERPTLLLDEVDAVFSKDRETEGLRAVLNAGNRRGGSVPRVEMHGTTRVIRDFAVFGPKAFAGIGALPETIADRSIPIPMQRRLRSEAVERFIIRDVRAEADAIRQRIKEATEPLLERLQAYRITDDAPGELSDRQIEGWEPLFAVASLAGGDWLGRARDISVVLHTAGVVDPSWDLLLLEHIRDVFETRRVDRVKTLVLLDDLRDRDDGPWARWFDASFDDEGLKAASSLAHHLKRYGIRSKQMRFGRTDADRAKGYAKLDFDPTWNRYLGASSDDVVTDEADGVT